MKRLWGYFLWFLIELWYLRHFEHQLERLLPILMLVKGDKVLQLFSLCTYDKSSHNDIDSCKAFKSHYSTPNILFPFSEKWEYKERLLSFYDGSQFWLFDVFFLMYRMNLLDSSLSFCYTQTHAHIQTHSLFLEEKCWRMCWFGNHNPKLPISEVWHIRAADFSLCYSRLQL